jgi:predicted PurR-regulated permease PerM
VLAAVGLLIIGVNDPLALGVITALGEPFPYVGPVAAAVPVVLVALVQPPTKALIALGRYCFLQEFEGHILTPNIMERQTSMPQTLVILAIIVGAVLSGLLSIIVAIPLAAGLHVFTMAVIVPAVRRAWGTGPTAGLLPAVAPSPPAERS